MTGLVTLLIVSAILLSPLIATFLALRSTAASYIPKWATHNGQRLDFRCEIGNMAVERPDSSELCGDEQTGPSGVHAGEMAERSLEPVAISPGLLQPNIVHLDVYRTQSRR